MPLVERSSGTCSETMSDSREQLRQRHRRDAMVAIELGIVANVVREHAALERRQQLAPDPGRQIRSR